MVYFWEEGGQTNRIFSNPPNQTKAFLLVMAKIVGDIVVNVIVRGN